MDAIPVVSTWQSAVDLNYLLVQLIVTLSTSSLLFLCHEIAPRASMTRYKKRSSSNEICLSIRHISFHKISYVASKHESREIRTITKDAEWIMFRCRLLICSYLFDLFLRNLNEILLSFRILSKISMKLEYPSFTFCLNFIGLDERNAHFTEVETNKQTNKQTPWPESASKLNRPSDCRFSAKLLPTFFRIAEGRVVSTADPLLP
jgi:hypothetical protein